MPNGVYPIPRFRAGSVRARLTTARRLRVWWHRLELDEQLAAGVHPQPGTLLEDRAEQLGSREERVRLARALENTLHEARKTAPVLGTRLPLRRRDIRRCDEDILALVRRLEDEHPIDVQGAAMVSLLLFEGASPLFQPGDRSLRFAVRSARLALDHPDEYEPALLEAA
jgi:hypothetical protein